MFCQYQILFFIISVSRDINGHTPFMCAVNVRAYTAAHIIWNCIERLSQGNPSGFFFNFNFLTFVSSLYLFIWFKLSYKIISFVAQILDTKCEKSVISKYL